MAARPDADGGQSVGVEATGGRSQGARSAQEALPLPFPDAAMMPMSVPRATGPRTAPRNNAQLGSRCHAHALTHQPVRGCGPASRQVRLRYAAMAVGRRPAIYVRRPPGSQDLAKELGVSVLEWGQISRLKGRSGHSRRSEGTERVCNPKLLASRARVGR